MRTTLCLLTSLAFLAAALPSTALGQDGDGDGAPDVSDAFPCDPERASVSWYPTEASSALLSFEDEWPSHTDLDYNDVVVRAHYRIESHADGRVKSLHLSFDPVALGGDFSNGLALQLPAPWSRLVSGQAVANVSASRRLGGGGWTSLVLDTNETLATWVLSGNLRELFSNTTGRINSRAQEARLEGARLEVEIVFAQATTFASQPAPFDVFVFRSGTGGPSGRHEIHFPAYSGTQQMNGGLFGLDQDASEPGARYFILGSGTPAALNLLTTTRYPLEGEPIHELFPRIVDFALSRGQAYANFYEEGTDAQGRARVQPDKGHSVLPISPPTRPAPDTSCAAPSSPRSCLVSNGVGSQSYIDGAWSVCEVASCNAGFGHCDASHANGCETNTLTSSSHCGACGNTCGSGRSCYAGRCSATCTNNITFTSPVAGCMNLSPFALSYTASHQGSQAVSAGDANRCTSFNAQSYPPVTWQVDLGAVHSVAALSLRPNMLPSTAQVVHVIEGSLNGTSWSNVLTVSQTMTTEVVYPFVLPVPVSVRHVRIRTTSSPSWVAWSDINIWGDCP
jgi:LruC domain-containing protein